MKLRRTILAFVSIMLMFTACSSEDTTDNNPKGSASPKVGQVNTQAGEHAGVSEIDISFVEDIERVDFAVDDQGNLYVTNKDKIHVLDADGKEIRTVDIINPTHKFKGFCSSVTVGDGFIFANDVLKGVDDQEVGPVVRQYTLEGQLIKEHRFDGLEHSHKMFYLQGRLFVLDEDHSSEKGANVIMYQIEDSRTDIIELDQRIFDVVPYKDNQVLILTITDNCGEHFVIYDYSQKKVVEEKHASFSLVNTSYDDKEDLLYSFFQGGVMKISIENDDKQAIYNNRIPNSGKSIYRNGYCYILDKEGKSICRYNPLVHQASETLRIMLSSSVMSNALDKVIEEFNHIYPQIRVEIQSLSPQEYDSNLSKKLMAGDNDFDVFLIRGSSAYNYIRNNTMEYLDKYDGFIKKFDSMFEGVKELCSYNEKIFGVPINLKNAETVFQINKSLFMRLGLEVPKTDWTWDDFYSLAIKARQKSENGEANYIMKMDKKEFWLLCMQWMYDACHTNLIEGHVDYTTEEYISMLNLLKKMYSEDLILDEGRYSSSSNDNILMQFTMIPVEGYGNEGIIPPPLCSTQKAYPFTQVDYLCINKDSEKKDAAAAFLEICISEEAQAGDYIMGGPVLYKDKELYKGSQYYRLLSKDEFYQPYSEILKYSRRAETMEFSQMVYEHIEQFLNGEITAEETAKRIDQKTKMVVQE